MKEENQIIDSILAGNKDEFRLLVDSYKSLAYSLAYKTLHNHSEAEEATHESFIKAYKALGQFNREAKFSTWLYRIVYNTALTYIRKRKNKESFEIRKFENISVVNEKNSFEQADQSKYIQLALDRLPESDAAVLSLFYLQELNLEEISAVINMTTGNVKVKLHRARKKMAESLHALLKKETVSLY